MQNKSPDYKALIESCGHIQQSFAREYGFTPPFITNVIKGTRKASPRFIEAIDDMRIRNITFTTLRQRIDTLFDAIAHGDEKHRDWLRQAIDDHFAGRPVQREVK